MKLFSKIVFALNIAGVIFLLLSMFTNVLESRGIQHGHWLFYAAYLSIGFSLFYTYFNRKIKK